MKHAAWLVLLFGVQAFGQDVTGNAAAGALEKRMESLRLFGRPTDGKLLVERRVVAPMRSIQKVMPKVCAMPLLPARPEGSDENMTMVKPVAPAEKMRTDAMPAPACDPAFIGNR